MNGGFDTHANYICYHNYMDRDGLPREFQDSDKVERISDKIHFPEKFLNLISLVQIQQRINFVSLVTVRIDLTVSA